MIFFDVDKEVVVFLIDIVVKVNREVVLEMRESGIGGGGGKWGRDKGKWKLFGDGDDRDRDDDVLEVGVLRKKNKFIVGSKKKVRK